MGSVDELRELMCKLNCACTTPTPTLMSGIKPILSSSSLSTDYVSYDAEGSNSSEYDFDRGDQEGAAKSIMKQVLSSGSVSTMIQDVNDDSVDEDRQRCDVSNEEGVGLGPAHTPAARQSPKDFSHSRVPSAGLSSWQVSRSLW